MFLQMSSQDYSWSSVWNIVSLSGIVFLILQGCRKNPPSIFATLQSA